MVTLITTEVTRELLIHLYTKLTGNCSHEKSQDWLGEQDDPGLRRTDFEGGGGRVPRRKQTFAIKHLAY